MGFGGAPQIAKMLHYGRRQPPGYVGFEESHFGFPQQGTFNFIFLIFTIFHFFILFFFYQIKEYSSKFFKILIFFGVFSNEIL